MVIGTKKVGGYLTILLSKSIIMEKIYFVRFMVKNNVYFIIGDANCAVYKS